MAAVPPRHVGLGCDSSSLLLARALVWRFTVWRGRLGLLHHWLGVLCECLPSCLIRCLGRIAALAHTRTQRVTFLAVRLLSHWCGGGGGWRSGWRSGCSSRLTGMRSGDSRLTGAAPRGVAETAAKCTEIALQLRLRLLPRCVLIVCPLPAHNAEALEEAAHPTAAALEACCVLRALGAHDVARRVRKPLRRALATATTALLELGEETLLHLDKLALPP